MRFVLLVLPTEGGRAAEPRVQGCPQIFTDLHRFFNFQFSILRKPAGSLCIMHYKLCIMHYKLCIILVTQITQNSQIFDS